MSYETDRQWGDILIGEAVKLIAKRIIVPADAKRDMHEATDLVVLHTADGGIAFRSRRSGYEGRFGNEFTIRYSKASGVKTEFAKIMDGYAKWMFYGHTKEERFTRWMLLDLDVFRALLEDVDHDLFTIIHNKDGSSFAVFDIDDFHPDFVIDQSEDSHERSRLAA